MQIKLQTNLQELSGFPGFSATVAIEEDLDFFNNVIPDHSSPEAADSNSVADDDGTGVAAPETTDVLCSDGSNGFQCPSRSVSGSRARTCQLYTQQQNLELYIN
ncbi:hypothetical protein Pcinc_036224 [Petrolisthes cinctipes]|uniref:Uncharacterized protein n=1 Tax=Petrolisthes cinctipes TaxID=88211 RepID=A0AAE1BZ95_PETCI|nr:hypothetical protein Pcinc_036224 [Petrolisthes cinctipes]